MAMTIECCLLGDRPDLIQLVGDSFHNDLRIVWKEIRNTMDMEIPSHYSVA